MSSFDVSELGDITVRDICVRNAEAKGDVDISGTIRIRGKLIVDGEVEMSQFKPQEMPVPEPTPLPSELNLEMLTLEDKANPNCKWRLRCVGGYLIYQKFINNEWVNKQVVS